MQKSVRMIRFKAYDNFYNKLSTKDEENNIFQIAGLFP